MSTQSIILFFQRHRYFTALMRKSLITNGAGEGNLTLHPLCRISLIYSHTDIYKTPS
jgi:hypothetical protein